MPPPAPPAATGRWRRPAPRRSPPADRASPQHAVFGTTRTDGCPDRPGGLFQVMCGLTNCRAVSDQRRPTPEERDERLKLPLPPKKAIKALLDTGPNPEEDEGQTDEEAPAE